MTEQYLVHKRDGSLACITKDHDAAFDYARRIGGKVEVEQINAAGIPLASMAILTA